MFMRLHRLCVILAIAVAVMASPALAKQLPDPDGKPADMSKPVQVFILMGQSNMVGFGKLSGLKAATEKGLYPYLVDGKGNWTVRQDVRNVKIRSLNAWMSPDNGLDDGRKHRQIGPEIGIGYHVGELLDAPVLIVKSCTGNRSLAYDLRPPSAPGYQNDPALKPRRPRAFKPGERWYAGYQYDKDVANAQNVLDNLSTYYPGATKYEIAGFCFWQGAKDSYNRKDADAYEKNLVTFIKDLRKDFNAPNALFVCATMGNGKKGGKGTVGTITDAQLAVDGRTGKYPEFKGNVATFYSNPVSKGGGANGHYGGNAETYMNVGVGMGQLMAELLRSRAKTQGEKTVKNDGAKASDGKPAKPKPKYVIINGKVIEIKPR